MGKLTDLPNIGTVLANHLKRIGIESPEQFQAVGAERAFLEIRARVDSTACLHLLEALAGAEAGVRKSQLSPERKTELKNWYHSL